MVPGGKMPFESNQPTSASTGAPPPFALWLPADRRVSLAAAVEYLAQKKAFALLPFGEWSRVLLFQVDRGHALFVTDSEGHVRGFLGWALAERARAEDWLANRAALDNEECRSGEIAIVNAWAADSAPANRFLVHAALRIFAGKEACFFKRFYANGRIRGARLRIPCVR
jgi:hemolysin-activating ACP:hemolysin acyltransferase